MSSIIIHEMIIRGFRNYKDARVNFKKKSVLIGANDIGKSNLLYAMRILLDKSLSESDLEPADSDFYAFETVNDIEITMQFTEVTKDCVLSKFREHVSDEQELFLSFQAHRDPNTGVKTYKYLAGRTVDDLQELQGRFYLKVLNLRYISSSRDLVGYINKERKRLLQDVRATRAPEEVQQDEANLKKVEKSLEVVNTRLNRLTFITKATDNINRELENLSFHNTLQKVVFDVGAFDAGKFVDSLSLTSNVNGNNVEIGGDGRNNQIFLALWAARNGISEDNEFEETFYCIEEPEAHLHPHQQRKLATYFAETLGSQVIISTHSPQIACEFPPDSIIRLYSSTNETRVTNDELGATVDQALVDFGYRLNVISAECFFAKVVFLVEGPSEVLFYKALARSVGIDLDRLNISILMVDGVGFDTYVNLLRAMHIKFVLRTDNDIFKIPRRSAYRFAGLQRCISLYKNHLRGTIQDDPIEPLLADEGLLSGFRSLQPPRKNSNYALELKSVLASINIFLANKDLESDLKESCLREKVAEFFDTTDDSELVAQMQKQKATFMYEFLKAHQESLPDLSHEDLAKPLFQCKQLAEEN